MSSVYISGFIFVLKKPAFANETSDLNADVFNWYSLTNYVNVKFSSYMYCKPVLQMEVSGSFLVKLTYIFV